MQIGAKKAVSIHYTLKDDKDEVIDTSDGSEPLIYLHGEGNIVPGLEKALEGKQPGDEIKATVTPAEGYGDRDERNAPTAEDDTPSNSCALSLSSVISPSLFTATTPSRMLCNNASRWSARLAWRDSRST